MKIITNNFGFKLLSLVIAIIVWLVVVNIEDPVTTRQFSNIPVDIVNDSVITNEGKVYTILESSDTLTIVVEAKRSVLESLSADDFVATADMKEMDISLGLVPINVVSKKNNSKIESITCKTKNVKISMEDNATKQFAISSVIVGEAESGFAVEDVVITPNVIKVSGPASEIEKIAKAVVKIDIEGLGSDLHLKLAPVLQDEYGTELKLRGVTMNYDEVNVDVTMVQTKSLPIEFNISGTPAEGYRQTEPEISKSTITLKGDANVLDKLKQIEIPAGVLSLEGATQSIQKTIDITKYLPEGVKLVNEEDKNITVSILIENVAKQTITLSLSKAKLNNLTVGYAVRFKDTFVTIEVSGDVDIIQKLTEANFTLELDMAEYTVAGIYEMPVKITAPAGVTIINNVVTEVTIVAEE